MTDEPMDDRRASELLRKLEQDRTQKSAYRDEIRAQVLDHYDQLQGRKNDRGEPGDLVVEMHPGPAVAEVPVRQRLTIWLGAAAAVSLIAVGAWIVISDNNAVLDTASPADVPTTIGEASTETTSTTLPPAQDPPELSLASGEFVFELPEDLVLVERSEGLLIFGNITEASGLGETIVVVEVDSELLRSQLTERNQEGDLIIGSTGLVRVNGVAFTTWNISPVRPDTGSNCAEEQGCLTLIEGVDASAIPLGVQASVDELVSSSGSAVVVISSSDGPLGNAVTALLDRTTIS